MPTVDASIGDSILFTGSSSTELDRYAAPIVDVRHLPVQGNPTVLSRFQPGAENGGGKTADGWMRVVAPGPEDCIIVAAIRSQGKTIGYVACSGASFRASY